MPGSRARVARTGYSRSGAGGQNGPVSERDRDDAGHARNARPRDRLGRPLPPGSVGVPRIPEDLQLTSRQTLDYAQRLLDDGTAFHAHEVLEAAWKNGPIAEKMLWQGLAQYAVGLTHIQRGNPKGARLLLERAVGRLTAAEPVPYDIDAAGLIARARELLAELAAGRLPTQSRLHPPLRRPVPGAGRFAPSPSGDLHLGNLRTALLAWLFARSTGREFGIRVEDLDRDRSRPEIAERQLADLAAIGLDWDGPVVWQSQRLSRHHAATERLTAAGLTYECYCTRKEIQQAATAPHGPLGAYPGTCRELSAAERAARSADGRPAALRLRSEVTEFDIIDEIHGHYRGLVDDFVLRRGDGTPAYNLAVVVDDSEQDFDHVVRGDDLLPATPRQAYLATLLGFEVPRYAHVPLVLNSEGKRLAKRDGAVTLADRLAAGETAEQVTALLAGSIAPAARTTAELLRTFDPETLSHSPWILEPIGLLRRG
ncbi:Glutamyl-Q tRNA(Asp) synthetase [Nocardia sp. RB56]|uniref:Glutamyl-Q tRNA(Asp) synthetase n=1 Tax=Nocardia aurantia TaxID=2585199 RepID=A0A7K0DM58_9NOCA|nr:Glutamyl-Q tRNA(Asp) synthetase [Nocardia aurantia]